MQTKNSHGWVTFIVCDSRVCGSQIEGQQPYSNSGWPCYWIVGQEENPWLKSLGWWSELMQLFLLLIWCWGISTPVSSKLLHKVKCHVIKMLTIAMSDHHFPQWMLLPHHVPLVADVTWLIITEWLQNWGTITNQSIDRWIDDNKDTLQNWYYDAQIGCLWKDRSLSQHPLGSRV